FRNVRDLQSYLRTERVNNRAVGFVPTMGALHAGHLSLVRQSLDNNQITVASIFVNPTQFNQATDLETYPRTPGKDLELLSLVGCDVVFLPTTDEVYPSGLATTLTLDLAGLDEPMEGAKRPGHFQGMAQVVKRLLDIVQPQHLYMGQKDYQQQLIVRRMIDVLALDVRLVTVPTERAADGLALSSRNQRLSEETRQKATLLFNTLQEAQRQLNTGQAVADIENWATKELTQGVFQPEYFSIVDGLTLQPITGELPELVVACTAVWADDVRLIDNMILIGQLS
ncbi:MAG: pantoate--beta-alanine ligase, partial [Bacteroidota bacterium]